MTALAPRIELGLYPTLAAADNIRLAALAEHLGFDTVWVADSPVLWRELWVNLTAIAMSTRRVRLGSAVTSGVTRHLSVTASAAMSLGELSGERFLLGLGNGDSSLATSGSGRPQTLAEFRATVLALRALIAGEAVNVGSARFRHPWAGRTRVPLYVAATGPRMLELAGEVADGVIIMVGVAEPMVRAAIERIHAGAAAAGRDPATIDLVLWTACAVSDRAPEAARAAVRANVARASIRKLPLSLSPTHSVVVERIRGAYDYAYHSNPRAPHADLVPDTLVGDFAVAGTSEECADRLRLLTKLPLSAIALALPAADFDDRGTMLARLAASVLPAVRVTSEREERR
jgi:5,10-methylenetetrahydromethanopterin reductase